MEDITRRSPYSHKAANASVAMFETKAGWIVHIWSESGQAWLESFPMTKKDAKAHVALHKKMVRERRALGNRDW